jgi:hypothetical protein
MWKVQVDDGQLRAESGADVVDVSDVPESATRSSDSEQVLAGQIVPKQVYEDIVGQV